MSYLLLEHVVDHVLKGEIVKRILYQNPDAEFIFCAGDDKVRFSFCFYACIALSLTSSL